MSYVCSKNLQQGFLSPADFYTTVNAAQREYLDYLLGEYQQYQAGRPIGVVQIGDTEKLRNSIAPLIYSVILSPNTSTGISPYPNDFEMVDAMWSPNVSAGPTSPVDYVYGFYNIRFVNQPRLGSFWGSSIDPIRQNPVYLLNNYGIQFYPEDLGVAKMSYIRNPPSIVWGYTLNSNDIPVWNPATSQNPIWSDADCMNIIARALRMVGVNLSDPQLSAYANEVKNGGQ